jgi:hypothetical protein
MEKSYKITNVQKRRSWTGNFGTFQDFALQLEGVQGWVSKSQKPETPEPVVGEEIYGHVEPTVRGDITYLKFKGAKNPNLGGNSPANKADNDSAYMVMMLEELTGRRGMPDNPTPRDTIISDIEGSEPFDLSEIPF